MASRRFALVGNADDHPRNHGLLYQEGHWRLAPAFDITPLADFRNVLSLATGVDGSSAVSAKRLLATSERFALAVEDAAAWLAQTSVYVANSWESALRQVGVSEAAIRATESAFSFAQGIAADTRAYEQIVAEAKVARKRTRRPG